MELRIIVIVNNNNKYFLDFLNIRRPSPLINADIAKIVDLLGFIRHGLLLDIANAAAFVGETRVELTETGPAAQST